MVTSEKRARMAATIENRMKTIAERLEVKDSETVGLPSSNPPSFYTATQKRLRACFHHQHLLQSTRTRGGTPSVVWLRIPDPCGDGGRSGQPGRNHRESSSAVWNIRTDDQQQGWSPRVNGCAEHRACPRPLLLTSPDRTATVFVKVRPGFE